MIRLANTVRLAATTSTRLSVANASSTYLRTMTSISEVIKRDHRELEEYYNNILKATTDDDKVRWQNQFTWELARHSIGEELVVYPLMEKAMTDGKARADHDRDEHNKVSWPRVTGRDGP
jgi:hemerythrin superfamily protein